MKNSLVWALSQLLVHSTFKGYMFNGLLLNSAIQPWNDLSMWRHIDSIKPLPMHRDATDEKTSLVFVSVFYHQKQDRSEIIGSGRNRCMKMKVNRNIK
jgi:hypothetical protein